MELFKGSSILVSGMAGSGKSTVAAHFIDSTCAFGERCIYFPFPPVWSILRVPRFESAYVRMYHADARNWYWEISDRYGESLVRKLSEKKTVLMPADARLLANSRRLIAESRELLSRLNTRPWNDLAL